MNKILGLNSKYTLVSGRLKDIVKEYPATFNLKINNWSTMGEVLTDPSGTKIKRYYAYLILKNKEPIAWAWTFHSKFEYGSKYYTPVGRSIHFYVYVSEKYRRKGLGSVLYNYAKEESRKKHRKLIVYPWELISDSFYGKLHYKNVPIINQVITVSLK